MSAYRSYSSRETKLFAENLAHKLLFPRSRTPFSNSRELENGRRTGITAVRGNALVLALTGNLGSGKTTFVQGFLRGLGARKRSASPTFILLRRISLRRPFADFYHIDAYRIKKPRELAALGLKEILADGKNIVLVEWAEKMRRILPKNAIWLKFRHGKKENERIVMMNK